MRRLRHQALYLVLRSLFAIGHTLPLRVTQALGASLSAAVHILAVTDRRRAAAHVQIAFPELKEEEGRRLVRRSARHLGHNLGEVVWLWGADPKEVEAVCSLSGAQHLTRALEAGRGAIIVTGHCGNWELLNARLGVAGFPMTVAVREVDDPRIDRLATALRARFGADVVPRGATAGRRLVAALARNRVDGLLIDQDIKDIPGVFVPFFGRPAWTPSGAATLALRLNCPVFPGFIHRLPDGRHHAEVHPALPEPTASEHDDRVQELTAAATAAIETQIRSHPEQWVWIHRRWKTRPADERGAS